MGEKKSPIIVTDVNLKSFIPKSNFHLTVNVIRQNLRKGKINTFYIFPARAKHLSLDW